MKVLFILSLMVAGVSFADEAKEVAQEAQIVIKKLAPQDDVAGEIDQENEIAQEEIDFDVES
jgi:3-hydroxyisobutyrate dehydrogenase-like beta-hydroxyacid dehydrogenase